MVIQCYGKDSKATKFTLSKILSIIFVQTSLGRHVLQKRIVNALVG